MKKLILELDELDYASLQEAMARRQLVRGPLGIILPPNESNLPGALLAEICRGWLELLDWQRGVV